ncbi:hypothetical protein BDM02DRAFT_1484078 [Thelephora ganbajun]|uniref:Uncharacterized protein n=1 Tax=Thelephora ganbajun TaxID=370292 RepID=A0ACB6ZKT6_THEGA|nr:hypothetical protein BDM02DRAFT_1484078 [Thelephora ganbajun]
MSAPDHPFDNLAREDVHKSCKALETVVNLLNGYCEAASGMVILQKKLVKAIRDAASMKASPTVANNALNITATIFEIISEVDGKFAKIADKECDDINDDVKKWFRKLAREERTHDEKIASASARIKHAGQTYEKKAKRNARDAAEEHTRYIQLLSLLGPEMSQEKINHSNFVAQKHAAVTCSISSSLARIADAEWARCCESVRKSSPQIGTLGEWRSLCDGGWMGRAPDDLPDTDIPVATGPSLAALPAVEEELNSDTDLGVSKANLRPTSRDYTPHNLPPVLASPTTDSDISQHDPVTVKSDIPALDHFPVPPVHFPLPHLQRVLTSSLDGPFGNPPTYGRRMTSPVLPAQESHNLTAATTSTMFAAATATQTPPPTTDIRTDATTSFPAPSRSDPHQILSPSDLSTTFLTTDNTEFGIRQPHPLPPSGSSGSLSLPKGSPRSSGVVLAMRNRFTQGSVSSAPSREATTLIPCLPVSVSTIAGRYQPGGEHPPVRSDGSQTGTTFEPSFNDAAGANTSGTNTDFERTRREPLLQERDLDERSKKFNMGPQRLVRSTSAQVENSSINRGGDHNQPTSTREAVGLRQNMSIRHAQPIGAESLQRGLTRSPSPMSSPAIPYMESSGSPQENPRTTKSRGWIRRLSMPVLSSLDGSKKVDSPVRGDSSQAWRSSLALPETKPRHRKASLDTLGRKSNQRR